MNETKRALSQISSMDIHASQWKSRGNSINSGSGNFLCIPRFTDTVRDCLNDFQSFVSFSSGSIHLTDRFLVFCKLPIRQYLLCHLIDSLNKLNNRAISIANWVKRPV